MTSTSEAERRAFERMYRAEYAAVYGYIARRTALHSADDALAEVFLIAWRKRTDLPPDPTGWLIRVAANVLARHYRATYRLDQLAHELRRAVEPTTAPVDQAVIDRLATVEALLSLPEHDREALLLTAWDGLDSADAAVAADCSPGAFRARLMRARARLNDALDERGCGAPRNAAGATPPRKDHE